MRKRKLKNLLIEAGILDQDLINAKQEKEFLVMFDLKLKNDTEGVLIRAIEALRVNNKTKASQLISNEIDNYFSFYPENEFAWLILSAALDQPESAARCLLIAQKLNPKNPIVNQKYQQLDAVADPPEKRLIIEKIRTEILEDPDNGNIHYQLAIHLLSTFPLYMTVKDENSQFWAGIDGPKFLSNSLNFSSEGIRVAKEELLLAVALGINNPLYNKRANYLISDIDRSEEGFKELYSQDTQYIARVKSAIDNRINNLRNESIDLRRQLENEPDNADLHYKLAQILLNPENLISTIRDEKYKGWKDSGILDSVSVLMNEITEELTIATALGLKNPLDEAEAKLKLAHLLIGNSPRSTIEKLLRDVVINTKKHLRRFPNNMEALEIQKKAYYRLGSNKGVGDTDVAIKQARSLISAGIIEDTAESMIDVMEDSIRKDGLDLEEEVKLLLQAMGLKASLTKASGDGGVDIIAYSESPVFAGKYIIQCKDWINPVGEPIIRDLFGVVMAEGANKGIIITTGKFTSAAESFAEGKPLELIDGDDYKKLLNQHKND
jgi:hypothetical protein